MEAGASELLAGKDSVCSAEGSRTEPDPDRAPEEDAAPPDELSAFGTLATLFAAGAFCCCHSASSSPATPGDVLMPSSMPGAVLDGLRTASRSCFSSLRTVRTAHTPAAAAASRQAVSTSAKALSRKNFLNCSIVRYSNPFCVRNRFFGGSLEPQSGVYSSFIRKDTKRPRMTGALPVALFFLCSAVREIHHRDFRHRLFHSLQNMLYLFYCIR